MGSKPDIAVPFESHNCDNASAFVIAARPKTNTLTYESVILKAITSHIELLYMANLSGNVVQNSGIIESQYGVQFQFAKDGKKCVAKYPEMVEAFEKKYKINFEKAPLIGALEAVSTYRDEIGKSSEELFHTMVDDEDFLLMYGQTVKRVGRYFVLNYDIPAVFHKHNQRTNIFVIAARLKNPGLDFSTLNHAIYDGLIRNPSIQIIDRYSHKELAWYNQVRRTYHISNSHLKAMFDMTDYVLDEHRCPVSFDCTPLGRKLLSRGNVSLQNLLEVKKNPLVRIELESGDQLVNILEEAFDPDHQKSLDECCQLVERIKF